MKRLDEIEARESEATGGPWEAHDGGVNTVWSGQADESGPVDDREKVADCSHADAEFIAHARADVPDLVAALRAALRLADELTAFADTHATGFAPCAARARARKDAGDIRRTITDALEGKTT